MEANDNQKLREALEQINRIVWDKRRHTKEETEAHRLATEALSVPARNCDIGTAKEQVNRFLEFCKKHKFSCTGLCRNTCPFYKEPDGCHCYANWAQMPYEEGSAE